MTVWGLREQHRGGERLGKGGQRGKNWDNGNRITIKKLKEKMFDQIL